MKEKISAMFRVYPISQYIKNVIIEHIKYVSVAFAGTGDDKNRFETKVGNYVCKEAVEFISGLDVNKITN